MMIRSIALAAAVLMAPLAQAGAPQVQTQAPGYYRMMLGDFEVTALSDGTVGLHVEKLLTSTTPKKVESALAKWRLGLPLETSVNGYLVNTGIEAGAHRRRRRRPVRPDAGQAASPT